MFGRDRTKPWEASLNEFKQHSGIELTTAEQAFFESVHAGRVHDAGGAAIGPQFVRALLVHAELIPNAALGIGIENCRIVGDLEISGLCFNSLLSITESVIDGNLVFNHAEFKAIFLDGTHLKRLQGVRSRIASSLYIRSKFLPDKNDPTAVRRFVATHGVDVSGSKIAGSLSARGARIEAPELTVELSGGRRSSFRPMALNLADADIDSVILGPKDDKHPQSLPEDGPAPGPDLPGNACVVRGGVSFQRARCRSFTDSPTVYTSIIEVGQGEPSALVLRNFCYEALGRMASRDPAFRRKWLLADSRPHLVLGADRPGDEASDAGPVAEVEDYFLPTIDPQPFEQLARVLRANGDMRTAQNILMFKEACMTAICPPALPPRKIARALAARLGLAEPMAWPARIAQRPLRRMSKGWNPLVALFNAVKRPFLASIGYGYRPYRVLLPMLLLWMVGALYYNHLFANGHISPTNPAVTTTSAWQECADKAGAGDTLGLRLSSQNRVLACKVATSDAGKDGRALANYPGFNGYWYAADAFIPIVSLRQEEFWVPVAQQSSWTSPRSVTHFFSLLGWILSSLGIAGTLSYLNRSSA